MTELTPKSYPIGTKVKYGHLTIEKTAHGWFDSNYYKIWVDESKIGTVYEIKIPSVETPGETNCMRKIVTNPS